MFGRVRSKILPESAYIDGECVCDGTGKDSGLQRTQSGLSPLATGILSLLVDFEPSGVLGVKLVAGCAAARRHVGHDWTYIMWPLRLNSCVRDSQDPESRSNLTVGPSP